MTIPLAAFTIHLVVPMNETEFKFKKSQKAYFFFKRAIALFGSSLGIILLSPILIFAAIMTKCTSKGPVLFKQKRIGRNEKLFTLYKFRSMRVDAPQVAPSDIDKQEQKDMTTKWGRFMRKTSIDELPQLFNIFLGHMSFIGPRPGQDSSHEWDLYQARHNSNPSAYLVKPGLSGMAQIYLHRDHDPVKKAQWDSEYVKKISFWTDLKLFVLSFMVLFGYDAGR